MNSSTFQDVEGPLGGSSEGIWHSVEFLWCGSLMCHQLCAVAKLVGKNILTQKCTKVHILAYRWSQWWWNCHFGAKKYCSLACEPDFGLFMIRKFDILDDNNPK